MAPPRRVTNAYSNTVCSPTRVTALWGIYSYRVQIGTIVYPLGNPLAPPDEDNPSMIYDRLSLPQFLRAGGYATLSAGKCHLANGLNGLREEAMRAWGFSHYLAGSAFGVGPFGYSDWSSIDDGEVTLPTKTRPPRPCRPDSSSAPPIARSTRR